MALRGSLTDLTLQIFVFHYGSYHRRSVKARRTPVRGKISCVTCDVHCTRRRSTYMIKGTKRSTFISEWAMVPTPFLGTSLLTIDSYSSKEPLSLLLERLPIGCQCHPLPPRSRTRS